MSQDHNKKQSVVFFSDIVGYTRLMGKDEDRAFALMKKNSEVHTQILSKFRGQIIKELGDGILATFETVPEAIQASIEIQKQVQKMDDDVRIRIGLHCGEIIFDHGDVFGDAVNLTSRIQGIGIPSCLLISEKVQDLIPADSEFNTLKLGPFHLKNVEQAVQLYAVTNKPCSIPKRSEIIQNINYQEKTPWKFWTVLSITFILLAYLIYSIFWNQNIWEKEKSVAVLPFKNKLANSDQAFFAEGLTEDIISHVSKIGSIKVIDKLSVYEFENSTVPFDSIAQILDVTTLLLGEVTWTGDRIQISVQLVDPIDNKNLWMETYNREVQDIFKIQTEIASRIANILNSSLSTQEISQITKEQTTSFNAYQLFLEAKRLYDYYNKDSLYKSIAYYKEAIKIDPNYALAYSGLADSFSQMDYFGITGGEWLDSALEYSQIALYKDTNLADAYKSRGIAYYYKGQFDNAQISFEKAIAYNPNLSQAIGNLATVNFMKGDLVGAIRNQLKSAQLRPNNFIPIQITGWIYRILGRNDLAINWLNESLKIQYDEVTVEQLAYALIAQGNEKEATSTIDLILNVNKDTTSTGYGMAGIISTHLRDLDQSITYLEKSMEMDSSWVEDKLNSTPIFLAYAYKIKGNIEQSNDLVELSLKIREKELTPDADDTSLFFDLAQLEAIKGNKTKSLQYLEKAFNFGFRDTFNVLNNPIFEDLKNSPQFLSLVNQMEKDIEEMNKKLTSNDLQRNK